MRGGGRMGRGFFRNAKREQGEAARDVALSARSRRGPIVALAFGGAILIAAIAIGTGVAVYASRDRAISESKRELENNARLLSRHYEHMIGEFTAVVKS